MLTYADVCTGVAGGGFFASQAYGKKYADKANGVFLFLFFYQ
jgi:hypothetical protein